MTVIRNYKSILKEHITIFFLTKKNFGNFYMLDFFLFPFRWTFFFFFALNMLKYIH